MVFLQALLFIIISSVQFVVIELFFGKNVLEYNADIVIKNVLLIMLVNLILSSIIHKMKPALIITSIFFLIVGIANYFVVLFRGYGIVFMDFYAIKTAATVAGNYSYDINKYFIAATLTGILSIVFLTILLKLDKKEKKRYFDLREILKSLTGIVVALLFILWINMDTVFFKDVTSLSWDHSIGIEECGYILYFTANAGEASVQKPDGYSAEKVEKILSKYEQKDNEQCADEDRPNVIMIMNESFADLRVLGNIETDKSVMPFFDSLSENTIKGYAQSSVYGGYTANSEFEFLSGCSKAFLPGNPYLQYIDDYMPGLISNLKKQGYENAVAIHPYNASGYNRNRVYPLMYFDEFLTKDDFRGEEKVRDYIGDLEDYKKIEELYEKKEAGERLCVFNVTMQNHNPYNDYSYQFKDPVRVTSFLSSSNVNEYLSLMKMSDDALRELITYFKNVDEKTLIVLFGDHQPHLPDQFYCDLMGKNPTQFTQEDTMTKHMVPFVIWANYDIPEMTIEKVSINYLSSIFLNVSGLKMSDYNRYLLDLYQTLPVISAPGYYDKAGNLYELSDSKSEYNELLNQYEMIQYNYLFDKDNRLDKHYQIR